MKRWQLQEAKNRLSELVRKAAEEGPQLITRHGDDAVVVIAAGEYRRLTAPPRENLMAFFRRSPLHDAAISLERSQDTGRKVDL
jgi:antitoxin Phd